MRKVKRPKAKPENSKNEYPRNKGRKRREYEGRNDEKTKR
jgi:hypothetical protein